MRIDLNSDLGEAFGRYSLGSDRDLMPHITSANVACGYHAGDPVVMARTVRHARHCGVNVGAHPGFPDLQGFGRRRMSLSVEEIEAFVVYQVAALSGFARAEGTRLAHVKPHGALYTMAAEEEEIAEAISRAIKWLDEDLILVGLAGSRLLQAGRDAGLRVAREAFVDRAYTADGALRSRSLPGGILKSAQEVTTQALQIVRDGVVVTYEGERLRIEADTLCIHGDTPNAPCMARLVRRRLLEAGVRICPMDQVVPPAPGGSAR